MAWSKWGFRSGNGGSGGGSGPSTSLKRNQPVVALGGGHYALNTSFPIVPGSLEVEINGLNQEPDTFLVGSDGKSFQWLSPVDISDTTTYEILTHFQLP